MTDEEYLKNKSKPTREEVRAINAEYLGACLYEAEHPEPIDYPSLFLSAEMSLAISLHRYIDQLNLLKKEQYIDEEEYALLYELRYKYLDSKSKEEIKSIVRDILHTEKPEWLGDV